MTTIISATELKNKVSEVLNRIYYSGSEMIVEHYGKPMVKISPIKDEVRKMTNAEIKKVLDATFGSIPDFPDVRESRYFRKRKVAFK